MKKDLDNSYYFNLFNELYEIMFALVSYYIVNSSFFLAFVFLGGIEGKFWLSVVGIYFLGRFGLVRVQ
jgi:hypothetical protein